MDESGTGGSDVLGGAGNGKPVAGPGTVPVVVEPPEVDPPEVEGLGAVVEDGLGRPPDEGEGVPDGAEGAGELGCVGCPEVEGLEACPGVATGEGRGEAWGSGETGEGTERG